MVYEIEIVCILLKMISTAVWHYARIENMGFGYAPTIESGFREQRLQQAVVSNLDIPATKAPSIHQGIGRKSSAIIVVQNPSCCRHIPIATWRVYRR